MKVWLTAERLRFYAWPLLALNVFGLGLALWLAPQGMNSDGYAVPSDYIAFWAAGKLALLGHPAAGFDHASLQAISQLAVPGYKHLMLWHYPPLFLLFVAPLALLPYQAAALSFLSLSLAPLLALFRRHWLILLAAPATGSTLLHGQNGFLLSALLASGLFALPKRPFLAGALLSLLLFKPHMAALIPLLLLITGNWRALLGYALGGLAFILVSLAAFGPAPWQAFIINAASANQIMTLGLIEHEKFTSAFAGLRLLGLPPIAAWTGHLLLAGIAFVMIIRLWRQTDDPLLRLAATPLAILLITPHQFSYDLQLAVLSVIGWLQLAHNKWKKYEQETIAALWLLPLLTLGLALTLHLQAASLVLLAALYLLLQRAKA